MNWEELKKRVLGWFKGEEEPEVYEKKPPVYIRARKWDHAKVFNSAMKSNFSGSPSRVGFKYTKADGTIEQKSVYPYTSKKSKDGNYVVVGYTPEVGLRSYRMDRMESVKTAFIRGFEKKALFTINHKVDQASIDQARVHLGEVGDHLVSRIRSELEHGHRNGIRSGVEEAADALIAKMPKAILPLLAFGAALGLGRELSKGFDRQGPVVVMPRKREEAKS